VAEYTCVASIYQKSNLTIFSSPCLFSSSHLAAIYDGLKFGADVELSHEILDFSKIYQASLNSLAFPKLLQCQTSTKPFFFLGLAPGKMKWQLQLQQHSKCLLMLWYKPRDANPIRSDWRKKNLCAACMPLLATIELNTCQSKDDAANKYFCSSAIILSR
jgi:hypothetical protein